MVTYCTDGLISIPCHLLLQLICLSWSEPTK